MEHETEEFSHEYVQELIKTRQMGSAIFSKQTLIRILINVTVIILASITIGLNELQTVEIDKQTQTGGSVRAMEARGFAIPFLVISVGYLLWDLGMLAKYFYIKRKGLPEKIAHLSTSEINNNYDKVAFALLRKYKLDDITDPILSWISAPTRRDRVFEKLYAFEQTNKSTESKPKQLTIQLEPAKPLAQKLADFKFQQAVSSQPAPSEQSKSQSSMESASSEQSQ